MAKKTEIKAPRAVTGVQLKAEGTTKLKASWVNHKTAAQPYDQLIVQLKRDSGAWKTYGKAISGNTSKLDIAVKAGHKYRIRVIPKNSKGKADAAYSGTVNIPKAGAPKPVSNLVVTPNAATGRIALRWKNNEGLNREYTNVYVYVRIDGAPEYGEVSSSNASSYVYDAVPGHSYKFRIEAYNDKGFSKPVYSGVKTIAPLKPLAPSDAAADRVTDNSCTVTWKADATAGHTPQNMVVQRSADGGAFSTVATLGPVESFTDNGTAPNHSYIWRVCAANSRGYSPYAVTNPVVTAPAPPGTPSGDRIGDGTATIGFANSARNVTATEVRRYDVDYDEWSEPVRMPGRLTSYHDAAAPVDAILRYQVRNIYASGGTELASEWSGASANIVPKGRPKMPTPISPEARAVIADESMSATFSWRHNPIDGSAQTGAQVSVEWEGGSKVFAVQGNAQELTVANLVEAGCAVELNRQFSWRVRTRGAYSASVMTDDSMSPWSEARAMTICRAPAVSFASPGATGYVQDPSDLGGIAGGDGTEEEVREDGFDEPDGFVPDDPDPEEPSEPEEGLPYVLVSDFPLAIELDYTDESGSLAQCAITVLDSTGLPVYACELEDGGGTIAGEVNRRQWAPQNNAHYTLVAQVRSTTSLTAQAEVDIVTDFDMPKQASLEIEADRERGWVTLTPHVADSQNGADADGIDVWRIVGASQVLIASDLADGQSFVDKYAPLNTEFAYRSAVYSRSGTYRTVDHPGSLKTPYAFLYYGEGFDQIARGMHSPTESLTLSRSRRRYEEYADRTYQVLYDGGGISEGRSIEFNVKSREEGEALLGAIDHPRAICKTLTGAVFWCAVDLDMDFDLRYPHRYGSASVKVTRIAGREL